MYTLYLDESGNSSMKNQTYGLPHFSVAGIMIHEDASKFINERAKQIKFKYFGKTNVVFHAYEIVNNEGEFSIFKGNQPLKDEFNKDMKIFLEKANFKVMYAGICKDRYIQKDPTIKGLVMRGIDTKKYEHALVKRMIKSVFQNYLCYLKKKSKADRICTGKITIEGAGEGQDSLCFSTYHSILGGCIELGLNNVDVRNMLTCISFATKKDNLIEVEIADMTSYFLNMDHRHTDGKTKKISQNAGDLIRIFKSKLFDNRCSGIHPNSWIDLSL